MKSTATKHVTAMTMPARASAITFSTSTPTSIRARRVYGLFPTGVVAVSALVADAPIWFIASAFTALSLDPPLVSVAVRRESATWPKLEQAGQLGVSVLSAEHEGLCDMLASQSKDAATGVQWRADKDGAVLLDGASAWLSCSRHSSFNTGDHDLMVLRVETVMADDATPPLVFCRSNFWRLHARPGH